MIIINPELKREIASYVSGKDNEDYLTQSRENDDNLISRQRAY
ncbi:hypothetical protein SANA_22670 [Gottschalkiaceae bacterium SANA]|nr:hypothetical protein SANA_22670 [Gottschalkiaceae bacterium SANA]